MIRNDWIRWIGFELLPDDDADVAQIVHIVVVHPQIGQRTERTRIRIGRRTAKPFDLKKPTIFGLEIFLLKDSDYVNNTLLKSRCVFYCHSWTIPLCVRLLSAFSDCLGRRIMVSLARYDGRSTTDYLVYWPCWFLVARCHLFHSSPPPHSKLLYFQSICCCCPRKLYDDWGPTHLPPFSFLPYISILYGLLVVFFTVRVGPPYFLPPKLTWYPYVITCSSMTRSTNNGEGTNATNENTQSPTNVCVCLFRKEMSRNEDDECQEKGIVFCFHLGWVFLFFVCLSIRECAATRSVLFGWRMEPWKPDGNSRMNKWHNQLIESLHMAKKNWQNRPWVVLDNRFRLLPVCKSCGHHYLILYWINLATSISSQAFLTFLFHARNLHSAFILI